jgi:hypothetical protein
LFSCIHYNPHFSSVNRRGEKAEKFVVFVIFRPKRNKNAVHPAEGKTNKKRIPAHDYTGIGKKEADRKTDPPRQGCGIKI